MFQLEELYGSGGESPAKMTLAIMKKLMRKSVSVQYVRTQPKYTANRTEKKHKLTDLTYIYTIIKSNFISKL